MEHDKLGKNAASASKNHSYWKKRRETNIQKPASQRTQKHMENKNQTAKPGKPNIQGAGGMGEAS